MKNLTLRLIGLFGLVFSICIPVNAQILNGNDATISDNPWQAALWGLQDNGQYELCGATIISDQWLITAAHCVYGNEANSTYIYAENSSFFSQNGNQYLVDEFYIHPNYTNDNLEPETAYMTHDIALVKIQGSFNFNDNIQPIKIINNEEVQLGSQDAGIISKLTGWGSNDNNGNYPETLQSIELPIMSIESVLELGLPSYSFDESMIFVQNQNNQGPCFGDSGSPMIVRNHTDSEWLLAGVFSKTYNPCGISNYPSTYISVNSVSEWINEYLPFGCTDDLSNNYDQNAILDNGSCEYNEVNPSWTQLHNNSCQNIITNGNGTYYSLNTNSLTKSTDNGLTWENTNFPYNPSHAGIALDSILFISSPHNDVLSSINEGESWEPSFSGGWGCEATRMLFMDNVNEILMPYTGYLRGIYKSNTDSLNNISWGTYNNPSSGDCWDICLSEDNNIVYSAFRSSNNIGGLYQSFDYGDSWEILLQTEYTDNPSVLETTDSYIFYISVDNKFYRSEDEGLIWTNTHTFTDMNGDLAPNYSCKDMVRIGNTLIASFNNIGLFKSEDEGETWEKLDELLENDLNYMLVNDNKLFVSSSSGLYSISYGCTDVSACNFNIESNLDDGSCEFALVGQNCDFNIDNEDGVEQEQNDTLIFDEFAMNVNNYFSHTTPLTTIGTNYVITVSGTYGYGGWSSPTGVDAAYGYYVNTETLTQAWFWNGENNIYPTPSEYNPQHVYYFPFVGDGQSQTFEFIDNGGYGDNQGGLNFVIHEIVPNSDNYSCINDIDSDGICDESEILGCTDITACNYNQFATDSSEDCIYLEGTNVDPCVLCSGETNGSGTIIYNDLNNDGICDDDVTDSINICTNVLADNYMPYADPESNFYVGAENILSYGWNVDSSYCTYSYGCTDSNAYNYSPDAIIDDESCIDETNLSIGCMDNNYIEFDVNANVNNQNLCITLKGCTDEGALNYNEFAIIDDGSCNFTYSESNICDIYSALHEYENAQLENIVSVNDTVYYSGTFNGNLSIEEDVEITPTEGVFIVKVYNCEVLWSGVLTGSSLSNTSLVAKEDYVLLGGKSSSSLYYSQGGISQEIISYTDTGDGYIIKLNSEGNFIWNTMVHGASNEGIEDIAIDNLDNIFICGYYNGCCPSSQNAAITSSNGSNIYINTPNGNYGSGFVSKLNNQGEPIWAFEAWARDLAITDIEIFNEQLYLSGSFRTWTSGYPAVISDVSGNTYNIFNPGIGLAFLAQYSTDGYQNWNVSIGNEGSGQSASTSISDLIIDNQGEPIICGSYSDGFITFYSTNGINLYTSNSNSQDGFIMKYNSLGVPNWSNEWGGNGNQIPTSITLSDNNRLFIGGFYSEIINDVNSLGENDMFLFELNNVGIEIETNYYGSTGNDEIYDMINYNNNVAFCGIISDSVNINESISSEGGFAYIPTDVSGCLDSIACNYNTFATEDDGTCLYAQTNYDCFGECLNDSDLDGICDENEIPGCQDELACNYDANATEDDGTCYYAQTYYDCFGECLNDSDLDEICDELEISGCQDELACNYDANATDDDGTCYYEQTYYNCFGECLNDSDLDGVCDELEILGCTDDIACNFDVSATEEDGTCTYSQTYYDCFGECLNDLDSDGVCDELEIAGCTDITACNFEADATDDNSTCYYAQTYYDCFGECLNDSDLDGVCDELEILGCTDELACNYDANATDNDGTCYYAQTYYDCFGECLNDSDLDGVCDELEILGCTDDSACNFDETATDDNGTCSYALPYYDCFGECLNDSDLDGVCDELEILGCTNPVACNFDFDATEEDFSCVYPELYLDCDNNCVNDFDFDEICDELDNCWNEYNPDQEDLDDDGLGDVCDDEIEIGIDELSRESQILIKMIDILGREQQEHKKGSLLFYIYDNGMVEKKFNP